MIPSKHLYTVAVACIAVAAVLAIILIFTGCVGPAQDTECKCEDNTFRCNGAVLEWCHQGEFVMYEICGVCSPICREPLP